MVTCNYWVNKDNVNRWGDMPIISRSCQVVDNRVLSQLQYSLCCWVQFNLMCWIFIEEILKDVGLQSIVLAYQISLLRFGSVAKSCPILCNPMNCGTPGFPVLHYLPEFAQTHVHWVGDATQLSHPLSPTSPLALNLSQHQGLFQWVGYLH